MKKKKLKEMAEEIVDGGYAEVEGQMTLKDLKELRKMVKKLKDEGEI